MSAFGGIADMTVCACPLSRSLFGVKRRSHFAAHTYAYDPKRTSSHEPLRVCYFRRTQRPVLSLGGGNETARFHQGDCSVDGDVTAGCARAAARAHATGWCFVAWREQ